MQRRAVLIGLMGSLAAATGLLAQEGHPLAGTWHGDWGTSAQQRNRVFLYMQLDGTKVSGMLNPGPNAIPFKTVTVDPSGGWKVHIEAEGKDQAGKAVPIVIDGNISEIGSYNRVLSGTWMQGTTKGDFKITRD